MNRSIASIFWITCFFCAGFATYALAQSSAPTSFDKGCVKTRCPTPSCFRHYAGGYYMKCPDGDHPLPPSQQTGQAQPNQPPQPPKKPPALISPQDAAGDWELRIDKGNSSAVLAILHLRLSPSGSLTGTFEEVLPAKQRMELQDVSISGKTITYEVLNGNTKQGTFSDDRQTITGEQGGPTWQRVRTLAQALAEEAKEKPLPPPAH